MSFPKSFLVVLASLVFGSSSLLAICDNCEPNPSSPTYASTVHSRPALANARGASAMAIRGPEYPVPIHPTRSGQLFLGSTSYSKAIPVLHLAGRNGLDVNLTLFYNSRVWTKDVNSSNKFTFNADRDWPAVGFRMGFGTLEMAPDDIHSYVFTEPDSTKHLFKLLSGTVHKSIDNTYMQYDSSSKVLIYKNGLQVTFESFFIKNPTTGVWSASTTLFRPFKIEDTNGNYISINYLINTEQSINTITDTLGRVLTFGYDSNQNLSSVSWNGQSWVFNWNNSYVLKHNFSAGVNDSPATNTAIPVLTGLMFPPPPNFTGGTSYLFSYGDWGIVNQIANYSAGGNLRNSVAYNYQDASVARTDFPTYTTQTSFDGVLTSVLGYQVTGTSSAPTAVTVTDPSTVSTSNSPAKKVVTNFNTTGWQNGLTSSVQVLDAASNAVLRTTATTWIADDTNGTNPRPSLITSTLESGQQSSVAYTYTTNGNVSAQTENDFGGAAIRSTAYTYVSTGTLPTLHILDRVSQVLVKDGSGNILAETDLAYDAASPALISATGASNHDDAAFGSSYTTRGNLTSTTSYANATTHTGSVTRILSYDTVGNLRSLGGTCCVPQTWSFSSLTQFTFPDGVTTGTSAPTLTTSTTYYPNTYLPNTVTDENNQSVTYAFDSINRLITVTRNADSKHFYTAYDDTSSLPTTTQSSDVNSAQQKVQTDGVGKHLRADLYNATTLISSTVTNFDELGRAYKRSNPFGPPDTPLTAFYTVTAFDVLGRPVSVTPPSGGASTYSYSGNSATATDPTGKARRSFHDGAGRLVRVDEPGWGDAVAGSGSVTITGADAMGRNCDPLPCRTVYDTGDVTIVVNSLAKTVSYGFNMNMTSAAVATSLAAAINADSAYPVTATVSGSTVNLIARTTGLATNYSLSANAVCDCTFAGPSYSTQSSGSSLTGGLDSFSGPSVASLTHPMTTTYTYDALNDLLTVAQGAMGPVGGQMLAPQNRTYAYDSLSNVTSAKVPETNQAATTYTYTTFNAVNTRTDPRSIATTYTYDTLNRLHTVTYNDTPQTPTVTYNYGTTPASFNNGRVTSYSDGTGSTTFTYNALGRITKTGKAMGQVNYNIQYLYNPAGEVTRLIYPSGRALNQTYDPIGRLQTVADVSNNYLTITPGTDYNSAGQLKHFAYGNGVVADFGYNDHFETTSLRYSKGGADLLNLTYDYGTQNDGEVATITDNLDSTHSLNYTYDAWARLSTAQAGPTAAPTWKYSYDYDRFGNRLNQNLLAGTTGYNTQLTIDATTNRITGTGNTYDAAGNMTADSLHTYAFDAENRITKVDTSAATYSYDVASLRAKKVVGSTTTLYIFSGGNLIAEYAGGAAASSPTKEYIGGRGKLLASVSSGAVTYYHADLLSTRAESNSAGGVVRTYGHLPYGEDWYETGTPDKWKFTTYERDAESQLNYAMNRFDSGRYGRFMSMDRLAGSIESPQSLNRYTYAGDDPINHIDPTGLLDDPACNHTDAGCGGMDSGGMGGWDFGSWSHGGMHGGAGVEACGVDIFCIQRGGIGPFGSPVAHGQNPAFAVYLTGGGFQIQTPTATGVVHLSCDPNNPGRCVQISSTITYTYRPRNSSLAAAGMFSFGTLSTSEIAAIGKLDDMGVWAARGYNVFQGAGTSAQISEANAAWVESVIAEGQPVIIASDLTEANLLSESGGFLEEEGFTTFGSELGLFSEAGFELVTAEEAGEILLVLVLL